MGTIYLIAFLAALGGAALLTPLAIGASHRWGVLDVPDRRKVHRFPVPRWGGAALFGGVALAMGLLLWAVPRFDVLLSYRHAVTEDGRIASILSLREQFSGILAGSFVVLVLGMVDDRRPLPALVKLLAQIIAAYVAMVYGVRVAGAAVPGLGFVTFPILLSQAVTLLWMLGFMNAVNLIDGLDGLAAGLCAIVACAFLAVCLLQGETKVLLYAKQLKLAAVFSAAVCGACLGFLIYNFHPARIFMGDGGALFLGFTLGAVSVIGTLKTSAAVAFFIPLLVVGVPVLDVVLALARRLRRGQALMAPDRGHIHHRLLNAGWSHRQVVLLIYAVTSLLGLGTVLLTFYKGRV